MKIRITLKDPDGIYECLTDAINDNRPAGLSDDEWDPVLEERRREIARKWFKYGDYCEVEIDTDANTARVIPAAEVKG